MTYRITLQRTVTHEVEVLIDAPCQSEAMHRAAVEVLDSPETIMFTRRHPAEYEVIGCKRAEANS